MRRKLVGAFWPPLWLLFLLLSLVSQSRALLSRRAKCAVECYAKCAASGTPKAVYCNCPASMEVDEACSSISEDLLTEKTVERPVESESGYKDMQTIWLRVEPVQSAFIYVFEFSVQSAERPIWTFAGASSSPQISISVPDACRDYQFRVLVVLRSSDPHQHLLAFRPKPIPASFPPFVVPKESIHMDRPKQSSDGQTLHVSVSWQHPAGFSDGDVYGYSPPTAFPIRCQTPEDRLSQPRLELIQGGARLHLALPVDVLQERCRIYMEVRMLPRCVRIEPFDIQISAELDCHKFPTLQYCKREQGPQCTDVVDLWGKDNGRAIVVWQRPSGQQAANPLFYVLNWGPAQSQGTPPFVTHRIVQQLQQIRVPGNVTVAEVSPQPGIQYGLQICAFYAEVGAEQGSHAFHIVPVIPFTCTPCPSSLGGPCIDCSKIEGSSSSSAQQQVTVSSTAVPIADECPGPACASPANHSSSSVHFISSDTVVLDVFGAKVAATTELAVGNQQETGWTPLEGEPPSPFRQKHSKTHLASSPISLDWEGSTGGEGTTTEAATTTSASIDGAETRTFSSQSAAESSFSPTSIIGQWTTEVAGQTTRAETEEGTPGTLATTLASKAGEAEEAESRNNQNNNCTAKERSCQTTPKWTMSWTAEGTNEEAGTSEPGRTQPPKAKIVVTPRGRQAEKSAPAKLPAENIALVQFVHTLPITDEADGRRMHQKQVNSNNKDDNSGGQAGPVETSCQLASSTGHPDECRLQAGCAEQNLCQRGLLCPLVTDLHATVDTIGQSSSSSAVVRLHSVQLNRALRQLSAQFDRLQIGFGPLAGADGEPGKLAWAEGGDPSSREHWLLNTKDIDLGTLFDSEPLTLGIGAKLEMSGRRQYGLSVCAVDSQLLMENDDASPATTEAVEAKRSSLDTSTTPTAGSKSSTKRERESSSTSQTTPMAMSSSTWPEPSTVMSLDDENDASAVGIRAVDPQKFMLAGPVFFLLGLMAGIGLFCSACIRRRRNRHSPLPSYGTSLAPPSANSRNKYVAERKFPARSVLAARTATAFGPHGAPAVGFVHGSVAPLACSTGGSTASTAATMESRLGGTAGSKQGQPGQGQHQHAANNNFFADNTARFFMTSAQGHTKNVHF